MNTVLNKGFTLIEMVIVITIMTLLIGIAAPSISGLMNSQRDKSTREELDAIATAVSTFTEDTYERPANLDELYYSTLPGFGGPYIDDAQGGRDVQGEGFRYDSWGNQYRYTRNGATKVLISSSGQDGRFGNSDDISRDVDVQPILRRLSLKKLEILNQAVRAYNATNLKTSPLSRTTTMAVATLVSGGYLPSGSDFTRDAFGDLWQSSGSPVVQFYSKNFGSSVASAKPTRTRNRKKGGKSVKSSKTKKGRR